LRESFKSNWEFSVFWETVRNEECDEENGECDGKVL
jgi:hypothetical protein